MRKLLLLYILTVITYCCVNLSVLHPLAIPLLICFLSKISSFYMHVSYINTNLYYFRSVYWVTTRISILLVKLIFNGNFRHKIPDWIVHPDIYIQLQCNYFISKQSSKFSKNGQENGLDVNVIYCVTKTVLNQRTDKPI